MKPAPGQRDPQLVLDYCEVTAIHDLLQHAATLLSHDQADARGEDGVCCHQEYGTSHWKDSQLIADWLTDLATSLTHRTQKPATTTPGEAETDNLWPW